MLALGFVVIYGFGAWQLDGWVSYFFGGTQKIATCDRYHGSGDSIPPLDKMTRKTISIPHKPGEFKDTPGNNLYLRYLCKIPPLDQKSPGLAYLHLGWIFGDEVEIHLNGRKRLVFKNQAKPAIPLGFDDIKSLPMSLDIRIKTKSKYRAGLCGLQPMAITKGSQSNAKVFGVEFGLQSLRNLYSILPISCIALFMAFAWIFGIQARLMIPASIYLVLALVRAGITFFADLWPWSLTFSFILQIPVSIASGFAFLIFIMEILQIRPKAIAFLTLMNLGTLAFTLGLVTLMNEPEILYSYLLSSYRYGGIMASLGILFLTFKTGLDPGEEGRSIKLSVSRIAVALFMGALIADSIFSAIRAPIRVSHYLDSLVPLIVACLIFYSLTILERSYLSAKLKISKQQQENAKLSAVAQTVQMIAHDVRKPFKLLDVGLAMLQKRSDELERNRILGQLVPEVETAIKTVEGTLTDILEIGGHQKPHVEDTRLDLMVWEAVDTVARLKPHAKINFHYRLEDSLTVKVNPLKIKRVLINLVDNAIDAMNHTGQVWFESRDRAQRPGFVVLTVGNTGSYIRKAELDRLFQAFYTKGKAHGTGLGLAICDKIIRDHGGEIWCESDERRGTEFFLSLPKSQHIIEGSSPSWITEIQSLNPSGGQTSKGDGDRIMVALVEDSLFLQDAWVHEATAFTVLPFEGPTAFFNAMKENPDLLEQLQFIITDYFFDHEQDSNGFTFAEKLRKTHSFQKPILLASNSEPPAEHLDAFEMVIDKNPTEGHELWEKVKRMKSA